LPTHLLLKGATFWGLNGLFDPPETGFETLKDNGVSVLEVSDSLLTPELISIIQKYRFGLIIQAYPSTTGELEQTLELAKQTRARAINVHAGSPHLSEDEAVALVNGLVSTASSVGVSLFFETHRGRITQDLYRTARLAQKVPQMQFTLDVSHYVLCEERPGPTDRLAPLLDTILNQTGMIHGRISNGQQIQVHSVDKDGDLAQNHRRLWAEAMRRWRLRNKPGSSLIFTPELGPPPYAIVDADGKELSDRLQQSGIVWDLAQTAWKDSATAGKISCWP
jgi:hypothetical protein